MLRSMTGFGRAQGRVGDVAYVVEIRAVNNRYFRLATKLPEAFGATEVEIEKLVRSRIARGSLTVTVHMRLPDSQVAARINATTLTAYVQQLGALEVEANPTLRIDLASLLQLPGVCQESACDELPEQSREGLLALVGKALDDLERMRHREGRALRQDVLKNCDALEEGLGRISARAPQVVEDYRQRLSCRVRELTQDSHMPVDAESLAREIAIFAERSDVSEEIARLNVHLAQVRDSLSGNKPAGRKLDFLATEMFREANTIGAKCNDAQIAQEVVAVKTAIDRIKEQAQNAE